MTNNLARTLYYCVLCAKKWPAANNEIKRNQWSWSCCCYYPPAEKAERVEEPNKEIVWTITRKNKKVR